MRQAEPIARARAGHEGRDRARGRGV